MITVSEYIQSLIDERKDFNDLYQKVIETTQSELSNDFRDFAKTITETERHLNHVLINHEIIAHLEELKIGYSTGFANSAMRELQIRMDLLIVQQEKLEETRTHLRKINQYTDEVAGLLNRQLISIDAKRQLYYQATVDIDGIQDLI